MSDASDGREAEAKRTAEDVYWTYVEKVGQVACADAVVNYLDRDTVVDILLEQLDPDDLEEFLYDNLIDYDNTFVDRRQQGTAPDVAQLTDEEFLAELEAMANSLENRPHPSESQENGGTHDWREQGF